MKKRSCAKVSVKVEIAGASAVLQGRFGLSDLQAFALVCNQAQPE
jgi:hypothetical protein